MRIPKANFIHLFSLLLFCSFTTLSDYDHTNGHILGTCPEIANSSTSSQITKTKAFYTALQTGDVLAVYAQMSTEVDWNGQSGFPYPLGDPHFNPNGLAEILFNKDNQNWMYWEVYDLKFEETAKDTVTVKGYYKATQTGTTIDTPFIHVWTWGGKYVSKFQHFETSQTIADHQ